MAGAMGVHLRPENYSFVMSQPSFPPASYPLLAALHSLTSGLPFSGLYNKGSICGMSLSTVIWFQNRDEH